MKILEKKKNDNKNKRKKKLKTNFEFDNLKMTFFARWSFLILVPDVYGSPGSLYTHTTQDKKQTKMTFFLKYILPFAGTDFPCYMW